MTQKEAAVESMYSWLSHEAELNKRPWKLKLCGEFDYNDMKYYIFKYKPGIFDGWLLSVCGGYETPESIEHCGHVFSEMRKYDEASAEEDARKLVEDIQSYWKKLTSEME